jgi:hypothetical protein
MHRRPAQIRQHRQRQQVADRPLRRHLPTA